MRGWHRSRVSPARSDLGWAGPRRLRRAAPASRRPDPRPGPARTRRRPAAPRRRRRRETDTGANCPDNACTAHEHAGVCDGEASSPRVLDDDGRRASRSPALIRATSACAATTSAATHVIARRTPASIARGRTAASRPARGRRGPAAAASPTRATPSWRGLKVCAPSGGPGPHEVTWGLLDGCMHLARAGLPVGHGLRPLSGRCRRCSPSDRTRLPASARAPGLRRALARARRRSARRSAARRSW
jgi:hypothetical protein